MIFSVILTTLWRDSEAVHLPYQTERLLVRMIYCASVEIRQERGGLLSSSAAGIEDAAAPS